MMRRPRAPRGLALVLLGAAACLPDNPVATTTTASTGESESDGSGGALGLLGCDQPTCTFVVVSQTLDDRVDVFEVSDGVTPALRGRVDLDLKPDPSGLQTAGNLLDEPYGIALAGGDLQLLIGHYPDTDQGSLVVLPEALLADVEPGGLIAASAFFDGASFTNGAQDLELKRREAIFAYPHASGRLLVGVFNNDIRALEWTTPSQLLVVDPSLDGDAAIGAFDLGGLDTPCLGAWSLIPVGDKAVALACDGSESVALVALPDDLGTAAPADAAAGMVGCGAGLLSGQWTTRFLAADGGTNLLALQTQLVSGPRLWAIDGACKAAPSPAPVAAGFEDVRVLSELVLLAPKSGDTPATYLVAGGVPATGIYVIRGGAEPQLCGEVSGLDGAFTPGGGTANAPYALALAPDGVHLAIGAGPPSNPESSEGRGQVLWVSLDTSGIGECAIAASEVVELNAGLFSAGDPKTWVRAPNVVEVVTRSGGGR
ncbi:MAG: hypothetical protein H6711_21880 [Myxococcales bacterium]|nr:hypothetical protein [Myxococcales bacterium]